MKPERIEELLAGTKYEGADDTRAIYTHDMSEADFEVSNDAKLNAARVQLLAKALRSLHGYVLTKYGDGCANAVPVKGAEAALAEAGIKESVE